MVELDGRMSEDPAGDPLSFRWSIGSAPERSSARLEDSEAAQARLVPDAGGRYEILLVVNDGRQDSAPARIVVNVVNDPPVADAGEDFVAPVGATASLDGRASSDANGDELAYAWTFAERPAGSSATLDAADSAQPGFTVDVAGIYVLSLIVDDGEDASEPDQMRVGGGVTGSPPVADAGAAAMGVAGQGLSLDGTNSSDPDGDTLSYEWRLLMRPETSTAELGSILTAQPMLQPDIAGTFIAELVVNDGFYSSEPDTVSVAIGWGTGEAGDLCEAAGCREGTACFEGTCVGVGLLRFSLSWTAVSDFDLHVLTPDGREIYFANPVDAGAALDVDDCIGNSCRSAVHVENIVFEQAPASGVYQTWVVNFNGASQGDFTIQVNGRATALFSGALFALPDAESQRFSVTVR